MYVPLIIHGSNERTVQFSLLSSRSLGQLLGLLLIILGELRLDLELRPSRTPFCPFEGATGESTGYIEYIEKFSAKS